MSKKSIYIIRHGETDFNRMNIVQGSGVDSDLNEKGREQAASFYAHYKNIPFEKVYTSVLKRTHQTVQQFIEQGIPTEALSGLNEISWGIYEGQPHSKTFDDEYWQRVKDWKAGRLELPITGGESPLELASRQKPALKYILSQENENIILICMHGRALKSFLCLIQNIGLEHMDDHEHSNTGLYHFEYDGNSFELIKANNREHLEGIGAVSDLT